MFYFNYELLSFINCENIFRFNHTAQRSHLHFRYVHQLAEFLPLFVVYLLMAFYVYFSLSKVALLRSKILLAGATVATVFLSVIMTIGKYLSNSSFII